MSNDGLQSKDPLGAIGTAAGLIMLEKMIEIRLFEDEVQRLFLRNLVRGSTHLCDGQEACCVGGCAALRPTDAMVCTYRGHGAVLAKGASPERAFAEILGRETGLCGGKGGSMHLTDVSVGAYGSFAIVGAQLPIAVGLGLASQYNDDEGVVLCYFGDGAANIGAFHESLNLASIWSLPVVFFCENNLYGEYSPIRRTTPVDRLADRATSYEMPGVQVDGNDVLAVFEVVSAAVDRARRGEGPSLIEGLTYRYRGHSRSDPGTYRPAGELESWRNRDPITHLESHLRSSDVANDLIENVRERAERSIREALARALEAASPPLESLGLGVYA
jgi:TPP-dependent pyruvate/acetoin dehydrogenase alpha subunit